MQRKKGTIPVVPFLFGETPARSYGLLTWLKICWQSAPPRRMSVAIIVDGNEGSDNLYSLAIGFQLSGSMPQIPSSLFYCHRPGRRKTRKPRHG